MLLYHVRIDLWIGWWRITSYPQEYSVPLPKLVAWLSIPTPFLGHAILLFFLISGFCIHYPNTFFSEKSMLENLFHSQILEDLSNLFDAAINSDLVDKLLCHIKFGVINMEY